MTPPRETLHEETLRMLDDDRERCVNRHGIVGDDFALALSKQYAYAVECVGEAKRLHDADCVMLTQAALDDLTQQLAALRAEVATLREAGAFVAAIDRGEIRSVFYVADAPANNRVEVHAFTEMGLDEYFGTDALAAYHAARAGRTDA